MKLKNGGVSFIKRLMRITQDNQHWNKQWFN